MHQTQLHDNIENTASIYSSPTKFQNHFQSYSHQQLQDQEQEQNQNGKIRTKPKLYIPPNARKGFIERNENVTLKNRFQKPSRFCSGSIPNHNQHSYKNYYSNHNTASNNNFNLDSRIKHIQQPQQPRNNRFNRPVNTQSLQQSLSNLSLNSHSYENRHYQSHSYNKPKPYSRNYSELNESQLFDSHEEVFKGIKFDEYDSIPVETTGENIPKHILNFNEIVGLNEQLAQNIGRAGFTKPTPVQKHAFPIGVAGRDIMACAQTGSGKTAAYLFPMIQKLLSQSNYRKEYRERRSAYRFEPLGLVLCPTRELAIQILKQAQKFVFRTGLRSCVVYGGADINGQIRDLSKGVDVLIATPGRLLDFLKRGLMSMSNIRFLIIDEADRMLSMGFEPQMREIVEESDMPSCRPTSLDQSPDSLRQTMMFSATFPREIQILAQSFLNNYIFLAVGRVGASTQLITQRIEFVEEEQKQLFLKKLLSELGEGLTLIFVQTKRGADIVQHFLVNEAIDACLIHGDKSQRERESALDMFRHGLCPVMVATDVASRGLDIPNVKYVINYDCPKTIEDYTHRIGRTGRCGNSGTAISFLNNTSKPILKDLHHFLLEHKQIIPYQYNHLLKSCDTRYTTSSSRNFNRYSNTAQRPQNWNNQFGNSNPSNWQNTDQDSSYRQESKRGGGSGARRGSRNFRFGSRDVRQRYQNNQAGKENNQFSSNRYMYDNKGSNRDFGKFMNPSRGGGVFQTTRDNNMW